jgi:hypothetical protein
MKINGAKPFCWQLCRKPRVAGLPDSHRKNGRRQEYGNI